MSLRDPRATPASHVHASAMFILVVRRIGNQKARRWDILRWCSKIPIFWKIFKFNLPLKKDIFSEKV